MKSLYPITSLAFSLVIALNGPTLSAQEAAATTSDETQTNQQTGGGKGAAGWLHGEWAFDEEYTKAKYSEAKKTDALESLKEGIVFPQLVQKLIGSKVTVTPKEFIMITKDGNGKAFPYKVLKVAPGESVTLKQDDGEVSTYHKDGDRFWMASTGNVNIPFYFKRVR